MRKDLDEKLTKSFPNLYRDRNEDKSKSGLHYGYQCGNGWYPLLRKLSAKLEKLILALPENKRRFYKATQVKQKFGTLRLYMYDRTTEMRELIANAEEESLHTCEVCGRPGDLIQEPGRWITVSCSDHAHISSWQDMESVDVHWLVKVTSGIERAMGPFAR